MSNILLCGFHVVLLRKFMNILFLQFQSVGSFERKSILNVSWKLCCILKANVGN